MPFVKPLQISPDTARKLAAQLKVPIEHLMHMPQHILMQKLAELARREAAEAAAPGAAPDESADSAPASKPGEETGRQ